MLLAESTPQERAAYLTYKLMQGAKFTTNEAAKMTGTNERATRRTLNIISSAIPLAFDEDTYHWYLIVERPIKISDY